MAAEESTAMSYEKIYDMGTGLIIAKVQLDKVREQDINSGPGLPNGLAGMIIAAAPPSARARTYASSRGVMFPSSSP